MTADGRPTTNDDLPAGWVWTTLEDIIEIKYGKGLPRRARKEGDIKVFGSNGEIGCHNEAFTKGMTLIIGRKGSVGEVHLSDSACWPIDTTYFVDDFPVGLNLQYLFHFLKGQDLAGLDRSTAVPGINRNDLYEVKLPLPPFPEQHRIVAKIETLFRQSRRGREALDAVPDLLAQFRQAVLAAAFRGDLTECDPTDEPASVLLERIRAERRHKWEEDLRAQGKDPSRRKYKEPAPPDTSDLPELPEGWVWTTIGECTDWSLYGPRFSSADYSEKGVPVIRTTDIDGRGRVDLSSVPRLPLTDDQIRKYQLQPDDLLITRTGSIGKCAVFKEAPEPCIPGAYLIQFRLLLEAIEPFYLLHFLLSCSGQMQLLSGTTSVTQSNINAPTIKLVAFPLASLTEQRRIVARIEALFAQADILEAQVAAVRRRLEQVDQAILARAFRGELVPQDPDDEPASVLLERIRKKREAQAAKMPTRKSRSSTKGMQQPKLF